MNILTFDIEEWFHILDNDSTRTEQEWAGYERRLEKNVNRIVELLDKRKLKATFFCLGWVAREYPWVVRNIVGQGHEIACHSDRHQLVYEQSRHEFVEDLRRSIRSIEDVTGSKVISYRAPGFSIGEENTWAFEEIVANGIEVDCSVFPAKRAHGGFASYGLAKPSWIEVEGMRLKEFPINLFSFGGHPVIFSGGGYFRLIPYRGIRWLMHRSDYVMTYFHPRDFDVSQPVIKELGLARKFKSYYGLNGAFSKLERLVSDYEFIDLATAVASYDWARADVIAI